MSKTAWIVIILLLVAGGVGIALFPKEQKAPQSPDLSVTYPAQNRDHIEVGAAHGAYTSNPPSSGWHYALTAKKMFYTEAIPDEYAIHNLEHGDVWITYHPRISDSAKEELKKFAFSRILITPREQNETDIALVSWEHVDAFNLEGQPIPEDRIQGFIDRYRNKGPEKIPVGAIEATFN